VKPIVIIGDGGHSKVIQDIINAEKVFKISAILDDKYFTLKEKDNVLYGPISEAKNFKVLDHTFIIAIGNNRARNKIANDLDKCEAEFARIIHPSAIISPSAIIGAGTAIMANSVVNANAVIGEHAIINTASVIEHDNQIGNFAHISPGAVLTGNVKIYEGAQIGAGATIIPGKSVGPWTIIGAGSTVIHDIPSYVTAVGSPAKTITK